MQPIFSISVHDIDVGGLARSFELPLSWLELVLGDTEVSATGPGHASVRLSRTGDDVVVLGKVEATLTQPCARCLRDTTTEVEGELALLLRPARGEASAAKHGHGHAAGAAAKEGKEPGKRHERQGGKEAARSNGSPRAPRDSASSDDDGYEFSSDEADQDSYDGEVVVLDDFLREALLLEVPSFPLCSEDCPGIRPPARAVPARAEVIDPRLSPLQALKTKLMLASGPDTADVPSPPAGEEAGEGPALRVPPPAPSRPARAGQPPRPRIHAHRTAGSIGAKGASKKSKSKNSPPKKAK